MEWNLIIHFFFLFLGALKPTDSAAHTVSSCLLLLLVLLQYDVYICITQNCFLTWHINLKAAVKELHTANGLHANIFFLHQKQFASHLKCFTNDSLYIELSYKLQAIDIPHDVSLFYSLIVGLPQNYVNEIYKMENYLFIMDNANQFLFS